MTFGRLSGQALDALALPPSVAYSRPAVGTPFGKQSHGAPLLPAPRGLPPCPEQRPVRLQWASVPSRSAPRLLSASPLSCALSAPALASSLIPEDSSCAPSFPRSSGGSPPFFYSCLCSNVPCSQRLFLTILVKTINHLNLTYFSL